MKILKKFGYGGVDYTELHIARGNTYTTRDDKFPSTNMACAENPFTEQLKSAKYILDFGCGVGRNLQWIMENTDAKYIGLDPNKDMTKFYWDVQRMDRGEVEHWKERATVVNEFSEIDESIKFDYVIVTFVLQHLGYRHHVEGGYNLTEITKNILSRMNDGAVFFAIEHDSEEPWIERWLDECRINLDVYIRSYKGLPELTHRDNTAPNGGHHLLIFRKSKEIEV